MSGKKGMKKYPIGIREEVVLRIHAGDSQCALSREYGISRYAIQSWLKTQYSAPLCIVIYRKQIDFHSNFRYNTL